MTSVDIEITELMKMHQHIMKLQSELIKRKKVYWPQTRWGYSKAMSSWKNKISVTCKSCHTHNFISCGKSQQMTKHQNLNYTQALSHYWTHHQNQLYSTYCLKDLWLTLRKVICQKFRKMWLFMIFMMK